MLFPAKGLLNHQIIKGNMVHLKILINHLFHCKKNTLLKFLHIKLGCLNFTF